MSRVNWGVPTELHDVIVIGCGAAGVAAMSRLHQDGFNVLGLEASNRIGGRIHSVEVEGSKIDLGAQWCHGETGNIIYGMAKEYLGRPDDIFQVKFINSVGNFETSEVATNFAPIYFQVHANTVPEMKDSRESLGYHCNKAYWELINREYPNSDPETNRQLIHWFHQFENSYNAADNWFDTSGKGHLEYHECEGEHLLHWKGRGFETILNILMKKFPNEDEALPLKILFDKEVTNVDWNSDSGSGVKIQCRDGSKYFAKHAIVTLPLGVLQERHVGLFYPPLPMSKVNTINGLKLGTVDKMFLVFDEPWWNEEKAWFGLLWKDADREAFEPAWLHEVMAFNPCEHNPYVLCGWVVGKAARFMETLDDDVVQADLFKLLQHFFGKLYKITPPKKLLRSKWYSNPLARGSYSFRSMETDTMNVWAKDLSTPVHNATGSPVLCFAGEASSPHYFSTVHGAIESGFREADRIIAREKTNFKCKVVIVGAGIAGIVAASELAKAGIKDFFILESENRIGGRIYSEKIDGEFIEHGAQWLHGKENELKNISARHGLLSDVESFEGEGIFLSNQGFQYDADIVETVGSVICKILHDCEDLRNDPTVKFSVGEYLRRNFNDYLIHNVRSRKEIKMWQDISRWYMKFYEIDNSCDSLFHLSAKCWGMYDFNGEENQRHINYKRGYVSLLNKIMRTVPKKTVHLSTKVDKIDWKRNDQEKVIIHTKYNRYVCDHAIVTVSLGVLKSNYKTMFWPNLPTEHVNSIKHIGFSGFGKIFLQFAESWWDDNKGFQFVWNEDHGALTKQLRRKNALWVKCITGFDVVAIGPPNCLVGWVTSAGTRIMERLSERKVKKDCAYLLKYFLRRDNLPPIYVARSTTWMSNPSFNGCYSNLTTECQLFNVGPLTLAKPVTDESNKPVLLFAGEATHEKYFSTTHGAAETGVRQANVIIDFYN